MTQSNACMATHWKMKELMARYDITVTALAEKLQTRHATISALKNAKTLPKIGGERLDEIAQALTELTNGRARIHGVDLLEEWEEVDD